MVAIAQSGYRAAIDELNQLADAGALTNRRDLAFIRNCERQINGPKQHISRRQGEILMEIHAHYTARRR